jgi:hypothetical protein
MLNKLIVFVLVVALGLLLPSTVDAYGAAHVGYTHVGPNGVQHYGATETRSPYGESYHSSASGSTAYGGAYRGETYHAGYGGAAVGTTGYHYTTGGAAYGGAYNYGYVR